MHLKADCLARGQRELSREQAMARLAFRICRLRLTGVAGLAGLVGLQVGDEFVMHALDFWIVVTLMTGLTCSDRIGAHGCRRGYSMSAVTIHTRGNIGIVLRLQMTGIMQYSWLVALLTTGGNIRLELVKRHCRIGLMGIEIAAAILMTVNTVDWLGSIVAMHRRCQYIKVDRRSQHFTRAKRMLTSCINVTKLAGRVGR